jgi:hypothetical protein
MHIYIMMKYNMTMKLHYTNMICKWYIQMDANAYLPLLACWLNARCSQITIETILAISHNTCLGASS